MSMFDKETYAAALTVLITGEPLDDLGKYYAENVSGWSPLLQVSSLAQMKEGVKTRQNVLSNFEIHIDEFDVIGNKLISEWTAIGDHTGVWAGKGYRFDPTGQQITLAGAFIDYVVDDRIAVYRHYFDDAALLEQFFLPESQIKPWNS